MTRPTPKPVKRRARTRFRELRADCACHGRLSEALHVLPEHLAGMLAVLDVLTPQAWRSWDQLRSGTKLPAAKLSDALEWMTSQGLVTVRPISESAAFALTASGRRRRDVAALLSAKRRTPHSC